MSKRGNLPLSDYGLNDMLYFFKNKDIYNTYIQTIYKDIKWKEYKELCKK